MPVSNAIALKRLLTVQGLLAVQSFPGLGLLQAHAAGREVGGLAHVL